MRWPCRSTGCLQPRSLPERSGCDGSHPIPLLSKLQSLKAHVLAFVAACNFAKHPKALRWKTPFEALCGAWTKDPAPLIINPCHLIPGPNT